MKKATYWKMDVEILKKWVPNEYYDKISNGEKHEFLLIDFEILNSIITKLQESKIHDSLYHEILFRINDANFDKGKDFTVDLGRAGSDFIKDEVTIRITQK